MRAAVIEEFNRPWKLQDLPDPKPAAGQVVIKVHASGMCYTDLHAHHGVFPLKPLLRTSRLSSAVDDSGSESSSRPCR